jgi:Fe-S cluster biogenesis protein NfuA
MSSALDNREIHKRLERIQALLHEIEGWPDGRARAQAREIVQAILDMHGAGLERMLDHVADAGESGLAIIDSLAQDELVGSLLLLYGLHPLDLETRIRQALDKVRPYLHSHGGNVELLGVAEGAVRLRMEGSCHGCPSSAMTLKSAIEEAIYARAPDVTAIEVEGVVEEAAGSAVASNGASPRLTLPRL